MLRPSRSSLFVPGNRAAWIEKAAGYGADTLILDRDATWNRQLGYRGQTVMHPTHVPIVNAVFTPSDDEIAFHRGLIEAMEDAQRRGIAAVTYKGDMVDEAMLKTSRELLEFARSIGLKV